MVTAFVTDQVLDPAQLESAHTGSGAVVTFVGRVRDHDDGGVVVEVEYSAHPSADDVLKQIADEAARHPDVLALAVAHRTGMLAIGDVALVAVVATAHRGEAFARCSALVEEVKHTLPMWKRQVFADGRQEWVGSC
jgi:molybdopterin synthase catalytic subunit